MEFARTGRHTQLILVAAVAALALASAPASAQYFGRNKVQYDDLDFRVLETPHFEVHYYPAEEEAIQDVGRMSERWYERFARLFQHEFEQRKPLIFYADHPDFQQTNTLQGFISEGTGGVTESLKDRVIMPLAGAYQSTNHVLGHELVHAFQFNVAKGQQGRGPGGVNGFVRMPLWLVEGMAEYLSVGREDPHTAMWMRAALIDEDFPTIADMTKESRFFPYRFGQALWAYIGGTYGDQMVIDLFRRSLRSGFEPAIESLLGIPADTLSAEWARRVQESYLPLMEGRLAATDEATLLLGPDTGGGTLNVSPVLSPDGRFIAFLSERDLFSIDLFLADARTGEVIRKLSSETSDTHFDALAFTETTGSFSPDGSQFAFVVFAGGDNEIVIVDTQGGLERRVKTPGIGAVMNPTWSPDGAHIAFTGIAGGIADLFLYEVESGEIVQLTQDKNADYHPTWSPDGRTIAFASDRGPESDWDNLVFSDFRLSLLDVETRQVRVIEVFGNVRHSNPQYSPDGESLYFISDQDGFSDIYRLTLATGRTERITSLETGVSGITSHSPALSVASRTGELVFSVYEEFEFHVYTLPADPEGTPVTLAAETLATGRLLPPGEPLRRSRVAEFLADPLVGLQPAESLSVAESRPYDASLQLDQIGQPYFGGSAGAYGTYINAGASAFFSDMLGNRSLAVALQQNGTLKDIGGQVYYANMKQRLNWAIMGGHMPNRIAYQNFIQDETGRFYLRTQLLRIYETGAYGRVAYPLSTTRRLELGAGLLRYGFDLEEERYFLDQTATYFTGEREKVAVDTPCEQLTQEQQLFGLVACQPSSLNMAQASVAYVGDNSFFGLTSPIRGGRFRFALEATVGTENFLTATADWRRYYSPHTNLTVAVRGMHIGRWGAVGSEAIQPMYLGNETFIRGYSIESFRPDECNVSLIEAGEQAQSSCPTFYRLIGHRLAVANAELRVPLFGVEQYGLINLPFMGTELVAFADAGLAWDSENPAKLELSRSAVDRIPVFSAGMSARVNVFGMLILEAYYAKPFQRPFRGSHWGFLMSPGW